MSSPDAFGYVLSNVGIDPTLLYAGDVEHTYADVGIDTAVKYDGTREYLYANVGIDPLAKYPGDAEYVYSSQVLSIRPRPHIWFLHRPASYANEVVQIWGSGFGTGQFEYDPQSEVWIKTGDDPNPVNSTLVSQSQFNDTPDLSLGSTVDGWSTAPGTAHPQLLRYTFDTGDRGVTFMGGSGEYIHKTFTFVVGKRYRVEARTRGSKLTGYVEVMGVGAGDPVSDAGVFHTVHYEFIAPLPSLEVRVNGLGARFAGESEPTTDVDWITVYERVGGGIVMPPKVIPSINSWEIVPAGAAAYTPARKILPGTVDGGPHSDPQHGIIEFVAPPDISPFGELPIVHQVYVEIDEEVYAGSPYPPSVGDSWIGGGLSALVDWLMYSTIPTPASVVRDTVNTTTAFRLMTHAIPGQGIEQLFARFSMPDWTVSMGRAERRSRLEAGVRSGAVLGTWDVTEELSAALSVNLNATHRWLPDPAKMVAHPEVGTGVVYWEPSVSAPLATAMAWRLDAGTAPYVDPDYAITTRVGSKDVPAMVFDSTSWGTLTEDVQNGPQFSFAMVAVLHPSTRAAESVLLSTFFDGPSPPVGSQTMQLSLVGDKLRLISGSSLWSVLIPTISSRPLVIGGTCNTRLTQLIVLHNDPVGTPRITVSPPATNLRLYLGRDDNPSQPRPQAMDVLDFAYWRTPLQPKMLWMKLNQLDGIYGVSGGTGNVGGGLP